MKLFPYGHATHPQWEMAAGLVLAQLRAHMALPEYADAPHLGLLYITDHYATHAMNDMAHRAQAHAATGSAKPAAKKAAAKAAPKAAPKPAVHKPATRKTAARKTPARKTVAAKAGAKSKR